MPRRIQRHLTPGWRTPDGAVIVDRTSRWGNLHRVDETTPAGTAVVAYALDLAKMQRTTPDTFGKLMAPLRGKDLLCFCGPDQPCHADILLDFANEPRPNTGPVSPLCRGRIRYAAASVTGGRV